MALPQYITVHRKRRSISEHVINSPKYQHIDKGLPFKRAGPIVKECLFKKDPLCRLFAALNTFFFFELIPVEYQDDKVHNDSESD